VEYAYRHLPEVGACWLLQAEDPAVLAAEFAVLAAQLGAREAGDARDPVAAVHAVLARAQGGWLLVFDNVPDQAAVERFLPPAGDGRVVVTTQSQHWPAGQALDVPALDLEVAAAFLVSRTGNGGDRVAALRRYSLAALAGDGQVQVHRLVQAITRAQLAPGQAGRWQQAAVVAAAVPADTSVITAWSACTALLPHAQAALDPASDGMFQIAHSLGQSGSYQAARDLFMRIADARRDSQDYGPDHPGTLNARDWCAWSTGAAGDGTAARDQLAALLHDRERVSGPDHPDTLAARAGLARWTGEAGDPAARDQYVALVGDWERVSGPDHRGTLNARAGLARWTGQAKAADMNTAAVTGVPPRPD
jgi:hypothetical protein